MHNQYIDDLINYKLKQLKLMLDPADWNRLEKKFSEALENHIAQKLSNYEVELESSDWPALNTLLNEAFDLQIKNILADHQISLEPSDWGLLAASLDEQPFDQAIAEQLHGFESALDKEDWKLFSATLDEHTLDTQIREQLEDLEFQMDSSDWDSFESKIESTFDAQVKEKLSGITLRASSKDWKQMMAILDGDIFISEIREALDGVEIPHSKKADWNAMEAKLNQPLYTAFQEKFAFHAIPPQKGDWKAMESLLKEEEDPKPILLPWYIKHRVYLTAASVLILFILSPFWIGKDSKLRNSVRNFTFNIDTLTPTETISDKNIASAVTPGTNKRLPATNKQTDISDPSALVSAGTDAIINSIPVGLPTSAAPKQLEAQPAVAFQEPELNGEGVHIKAPEQIAADEPKSSPKIDLGIISREGLLRSIPFQSFANPWMMGPDPHANEIKKVSGFKRKRQSIRLGLYLGTSKTVVELSSPKATAEKAKKNFGETFITGVRAEFNIKRNFYFVTGLNYEKRKFEHQYQFFPSPESTPLGRLFNPDEVPVPIDQFISADIQMLELPLLFRLLGESKNNLAGYLQVGVVPMISLQERYKHWEDTDLPSFEVPTSDNLPASESQTQDWRFNTYAGNINGAMGLDYRLSNELSIGLELNGFISFQRTKGSGSLNLQKKMYTGGIAVSLMRGLSRK